MGAGRRGPGGVGCPVDRNAAARSFPDEARVYFGHPGSDFKVGPAQALDEADTADGDVVQVSLAGGRYLALTVVTQEGSEGGSYGPTAELRLVTRNLGDVPDDVQTFGTDKVWNGPAFYPAVLDQRASSTSASGYTRSGERDAHPGCG